MKNKMDLELFFSPVSMICPLVGRHGGETLVVEGGGFSALWGKVTSVFLHRGRKTDVPASTMAVCTTSYHSPRGPASLTTQ